MTESQLAWGQATSLIDYRFEVLDESYLRPPHAGKDFEQSRLADRLMHVPERTFLAVPSHFNDVNMVDDSLCVDGYLIPEMAQGRRESKWNVTFGQLVLHSKSQGEHTELVAVKPMPVRAAAKEFHASETAAQRLWGVHGRRITYTPLGFFRDAANQRVHLVTRYEHSVQTTDGVMWNRDEMPSIDRVIDVFRKAAITLGDLHGEAGMAHGDAQPKNVAADNRGVRLVDLEGASDFYTARGEVDTLRAQRLTGQDIEDFLTKLGGDYTSFIREHFAELYVARVALGQILPQFARLSVGDVSAIGKLPQQSIPYLT